LEQLNLLRAKIKQLELKSDIWASFSSRSLNSLPVDKFEEFCREFEIAESNIKSEKKDRSLCNLCAEKQAIVIFYPCKHKVACRACADQVQKCPICRANIADKFTPFS